MYSIISSLNTSIYKNILYTLNTLIILKAIIQLSSYSIISTYVSSIPKFLLIYFSKITIKCISYVNSFLMIGIIIVLKTNHNILYHILFTYTNHLQFIPPCTCSNIKTKQNSISRIHKQHMMFNILQWNINGYINNYNELQILIKQYSHKIITIQESHIHTLVNTPIPINYHIYSTNSSTTRYGGVAILIHKTIEHKVVTLEKDFEVKSGIKFLIVCAYIPPSPQTKLQTINIDNVFGNLHTPAIITADFNGWHRTWGSPTNNQRGKIIEKFITNSQFIILNNGTPTHLSTHGTLTHVDLTFCSSSIATMVNWKVENNLFGSDFY